MQITAEPTRYHVHSPLFSSSVEDTKNDKQRDIACCPRDKRPLGTTGCEATPTEGIARMFESALRRHRPLVHEGDLPPASLPAALAEPGRGTFLDAAPWLGSAPARSAPATCVTLGSWTSP